MVMKKEESERYKKGYVDDYYHARIDIPSDRIVVLADIAVSLERIADALETALQGDSQYLPGHFRTRSL
jgi:GTP:adenosylcobinamide-phosphate guanylyltransferase